MIKIDSNTAKQEDEQQVSINEKIKAEIKVFFFATENLKAETKEDKVINWWNLNKSKYLDFASFAKILLHHHLLFIPIDYFLKLRICMSKSVIDCLIVIFFA